MADKDVSQKSKLTYQELFDVMSGFGEVVRAMGAGAETKVNVSQGIKHLQEITERTHEQRLADSAETPRRFAVMPYGNAYHSAGRGIEKPTFYHSVPLVHLRAASKQVALLRSIHAVVERDMKQFAKRVVHEGDVGYKIMHKEECNDEFNPKGVEKEVLEVKRRHIQSLFDQPDPMFAKTFHNFMTKMLTDHLEIDRTCIAIGYKNDPEYFELSGRLQRPVSFTPVDGITIKPVYEYVNQFLRRQYGYQRATPDMYKRGIDELSRQHMRNMLGKTRASDFYDLAYVQEQYGSLVNYFTEEEIVVGIANPRPDLGWYGYGESNVERCVSMILAFTYAFTYNVRNFEDGVLPEGIVSVVGDFVQESLQATHDRLLHQTSGTPLNMHRTPWFHISASAAKEGSGVKYTPLRPHNKDMLYHEWMHLVTALTCSVYSLPIEKLQMDKGAGTGLDASGNFRLEQMREFAYLRSYLYFFKSMMDELVRKVHPEFCFEWEGIRHDDEERKLDLIAKRTYLTLDEKRSRDGLKTYEESLKDDFDVGQTKMKDVAKIVGNLVLEPQLQAINQEIVQAALGTGGAPGEGPPGEMPALPPGPGEDDEDVIDAEFEEMPEEEEEDKPEPKGKKKKEEEGVTKSFNQPRVNARFRR